MIAHLSYVMCDECGNPGQPGDDALEARAQARREGFRCGKRDLCPSCVEASLCESQSADREPPSRGQSDD